MAKNKFKGMPGAYAAMFMPYDAKRFVALGIAKQDQALKTGGRIK